MQVDPDLARLLDEVAAFVRRYIVLSEPQAAAVALWVAHSHAIDAAETTPYLSVTSAAKRSGKSRLLEVLALLVRAPLPSANISDAALFRAIEERSPTLLMDEIDSIFGPKARDREDLRGLLNAGYRRGTPALRMGGAKMTELQEFTTYCPKALAGIGRLPDTIADRSIPIALKRRTRAEHVERFRHRDAMAAAEPLSQALASLAAHHVPGLAEARPELPEALGDRAQDSWEPLLAIGDLAGGDWPERARRSALVLAETDDDEEELGIRLLRDVKQIFEASEVERISTADLLARLTAEEESPWSDLRGRPMTARGLARFLSPHGIRSRTIRLHEGGTIKGFLHEQFEDAWSRYLPLLGAQKVTTSQPASVLGLQATSIRNTTPLVTDRKVAANPHEQTDVTDVTDRPPGKGAGDDSDDPKRVPLPGESDYPDFIDERCHAGNLTESEWLGLRKWHALEATA